MSTLLTVGLAIALGFVLAIVWLISRARARQNRQTANRERNLFNLQVGDFVDCLGTYWVVEGILTYDDDGFTWLEYMLADGDRLGWLAVEEDDMLEVSISYPTAEIDLDDYGGVPPKRLDFRGDSYRLVESGSAEMTRAGNTRDRNAERCDYYEYEGPDDKVLAIERWGNSWEVTYGESLSPSTLRLIPGDGESLYRSQP